MTCFMVESLFSEFMDGWLPEFRASDVQKHLESCSHCQLLSEQMQKQRSWLSKLEHPLVAASTGVGLAELLRKNLVFQRRKRRLRKFLMWVALPMGVAGIFLLDRYETKMLGWFRTLRVESMEKYQPLQHGAGDVLQEQAKKLHLKDPFMKSLWEEGGLSPEEYESMYKVEGRSGKLNESKLK